MFHGYVVFKGTKIIVLSACLSDKQDVCSTRMTVLKGMYDRLTNNANNVSNSRILCYYTKAIVNWTIMLKHGLCLINTMYQS